MMAGIGYTLDNNAFCFAPSSMVAQFRRAGILAGTISASAAFFMAFKLPTWSSSMSRVRILALSLVAALALSSGALALTQSPRAAGTLTEGQTGEALWAGPGGVPSCTCQPEPGTFLILPFGEPFRVID